MAHEKPGFRAVPFPRMRRILVDAFRYGRQQSVVHALFEFDITRARECLRERRERSGTSLSLTAYITACLARAVEADRAVHAYRNWRNQLIIFDDVDVSVVVEVPSGDRTYPMLSVIRSANRKSAGQIDAEIRSAKSTPGLSDGIGQTKLVRRFLVLPRLLRDMVYWVYRRNPHLWKRQGGTVGLTSISMFVRDGGWVIPITNYTLNVCVGGIFVKPTYVGDTLMKRQFIAITVSINHDVVDGGPAARFVQRFRALVESARLLTDEDPAGGDTEQTPCRRSRCG